MVYSINSLDNFCNSNYIQLFYYEPNTHTFYIKENNDFKETILDLNKPNESDIPFIFDFSYLKQDFKENQKKCTDINMKYNSFLAKKRKKNEKFSYKINKFDFETVFDFTKDYFNNTYIIGYIDLNKNHPDIHYYNRLSTKQAVIFLKLTSLNKYKVDSLIYNNNLFKQENNELKLINNIKIDRNNDFMVIIGFDSILSSLTSLF